MEKGQTVWLRSSGSRWGWIPAVVHDRAEVVVSRGLPALELTLRDDPRFSSSSSSGGGGDGGGGYGHHPIQAGGGGGGGGGGSGSAFHEQRRSRDLPSGDSDGYARPIPPFEYVLRVVDGGESIGRDDDDGDGDGGGLLSSEVKVRDEYDGHGTDRTDDLIGLAHLHEPAILHALRLRYDDDVIYTSTGPILIAINPFKKMDRLYGERVMEGYRRAGERRCGNGNGGGGGGGAAAGRDAASADGGDADNNRYYGEDEDDEFIGDLTMIDSDDVGDDGRRTGQGGAGRTTTTATTAKAAAAVVVVDDAADGGGRPPPHVYRTADDAYRAMMRGIEMSNNNNNATGGGGRDGKGGGKGKKKNDHHHHHDDDSAPPANQSILVSGESGAGKTVTTKIVLNYLAMLSKRVAEVEEKSIVTWATIERQEGQVLNSNPILEAFGNARTVRNDNSSRFGKYIDVRFMPNGKLVGATVDTYLLEKVRLIRQSAGERNFHVFYQLLESSSSSAAATTMSAEERASYRLGENAGYEDFALLNGSGTYDRRDMVVDADMHEEMMDAMRIMGFDQGTIRDIMRLIVAILYAGNMTFSETNHGETCVLVEDGASLAVASLLGVSHENLASSLTSRVLILKEGNITKELSAKHAYKAAEGLIKSMYGANFDYIVEAINRCIRTEQRQDRTSKIGRQRDTSAYIGVLDIFGFETFEVNSFEQLCINYTNETLQQHFNQHVFKMEQQEYEREGILWKFISFPDNQDVLDLINMKNVGIFAVLDEQCIVEWGSDDKFVQQLYARCGPHDRFDATASQRPDRKFSIDHYAGLVEYSTDDWIEKNKDQLPVASVELLMSSNFDYIGKLQSFVRAEGAGGRGSVAMRSVGAKFAEQLVDLRARINATSPHYIRCLKPNDDLLPDDFDPKQIVEQLRYSGVLEAVRVTRAGYPTRYPHFQFISRYYMLGDLGQDGTKRNKDILQLVKFVSKHVWEADLKKAQAREAVAQSQLLERGSGTYQKSQILSAVKKKKKKRMNAQSNIEIPETEAEFDKLDFGTRCAVAGLQLGRTKVFLRREAFDRIENLRVAILGKSARVIQAKMRGRVQRHRYLRLRKSTIKCQAIIRFFLANLDFIRARNKARVEKWASTTIQMAYRRYTFRNLGADKKKRMIIAAIMIQSFTRGSLTRLHLDDKLVTKQEGGAATKSMAIAAVPSTPVMIVRTGLTMEEISEMKVNANKLFSLLSEDKWDAAIALMEEHDKLAEQTEEGTGRLPLHVVAQHNLHHVFEKTYKLYPAAADAFDYEGRLPIHVAAEHDALVPVKSLLAKHPAGADTMMLRPTRRSGGGIPLHVACKVNASGAVITALLSNNFNSAKKCDANGDLPIHLLLRNGTHVSGAVVQALLDTYPTAAMRADMYCDLPLSVALKHECKPEVVKTLLMHNPDAAKVQNGRDGHSPLFLAFQHHADDKTILGLMNHAPDLIVATDKRTGMLPIEMATRQRHSKTIIHDLLKRDMPIDMKEKAKAKLVPHQYSWNHLVSNAEDLYHDVVKKVLLQCSQPQVVALAQKVENKRGEIPLATATPLCKHEFRVLFRLFHTLEIVDQHPAFEDVETGIQIYYAIRFSPPKEMFGYFTSLYQDSKRENNLIEVWDHSTVVDDDEVSPDISVMDAKQRLDFIQNEKGRRVIAKLTSRSDIVEAELSMRKDYELSRHYVPAIMSIHHTMLHAAYSEAMADPSYCITMDAADVTCENLILDIRRSGGTFPVEALKSIAMSLLHIHEHGLVHGDFGSHNTAKFGDRWKTLGVRGCVAIGHMTNPKRGFFHPPEAVSLETRNVSLGDKNVGASVVSVASDVTYDIWAYGVVFYEAVCGLPLSPYRSLHKAKRALTTAELFKVGQWDDRSLRKALRHIDNNENARDLVKMLLHPNPNFRAQSMRDVLGHPFFGIGKLAGVAPVFDRPTLGLSASSNVIIDIDAPHKEEKPALIDTEKKDDASARLGPRPSYPATFSNVEPSVKGPEPTRFRYAQSPPTAIVNPTPASTAATANAGKKSKFGIKGMFGKKK